MLRSLGRAAAMTGAAAATILLAACAPSALGPVLVAPPTSDSNTAVNGWGLIASVEKAINGELNAVNASPSTDEAQPILIELNALNNDPSLIRAEQFTDMQQVGARQASKREDVINSLIADVQANSFVRNVSVNGVNLQQELISYLNGVNGQLAALASKIASDQLIDVLRSDVVAVAASTRVYGLVEPMVHLTLAIGDEINAVNTLAAREPDLQSRIQGNTGNPMYGVAMSHLQDLESAISSAHATLASAAETILGLQPSGWPGNRTTIQQVRSVVTQMRSPLGAIGVAAGDVSEINAILGGGGAG